MKTLYCLFILFCLIESYTCAQDLLFSQYRNTPLALNPALVSIGNDAIVGVDYRRQQYSSSLQTNTTLVNATHPFNRKSGSRWGGIGVGIYHDESQNVQNYVNQGGMLSFGYSINLKSNHHLSMGAQGGIFQRKISLEGIETGSQWAPIIGYDPGAASGEDLPSGRLTYYNVSAGLIWYVTDDDGNSKGSLGVSSYNLNQPDVSFYKSGYKLPQRFTVHGNYLIYDDRRISLTTEVLFVRSANINSTQAGARLGYSFEQFNPFNPFKSGSIDVGARYAFENKTVITSFQFNQPNYCIGFSYDVSAQSNSMDKPLSNAFEIVFALKKRVVTKKKEVKTVENFSLGQIREFYQQEKNTSAVKDTITDVPAAKPLEKEPFQFKLTKDFKYAFNRTELNDEAKMYLDGLYNLLYFNTDLKLEVIGHTDSVGSESANKKISLRRARSVTDYLESKGVDKKRLKARGVGSSNPVGSNDTEEERAQNRRVEFNLYKD